MRLIDADVLKKKVRNECLMPDWCHVLIDVAIANMPTIEERKKGKWIKRDSWYCCSECGAEMFFTGVYDENQHYCYNCGSYNGGGDDEAD